MLLGTPIGILLAVAAVFIATRDYAILDAGGTIAQKQKELLLFTTLLSMVIIIPVFVLTFHIVRTYRVGKATKRTPYTPDWEYDGKLEALWWGIPAVIILTAPAAYLA